MKSPGSKPWPTLRGVLAKAEIVHQPTVHMVHRSGTLWRWLAPAVLWFVTAPPDPAWAESADPAAAPTLDAREVIRRVVARAREVSQATNAPACTYQKRALYQTLAADGTVRREKAKLYEVIQERGLTRNRPIRLDGRALTDEESDRMATEERRWRDTYGDGAGGTSVRRMDDLINEELFQRFELTLSGSDVLRGRPCLLLDFAPREGDLPRERLVDRVINLLHGRIWVDIAEYEIARAEVRTEGVMRLWGGVLGALDSLQLRVEREPSDQGIWYNRLSDLHILGRKLFLPIRVRVQEMAEAPRPADSGSDTGPAAVPRHERPGHP